MDKTTWSKGFDAGFITACSNLVSGHGEDGYAKFLLIGAYSKEELRKLLRTMDNYDKQFLRPVIKSLLKEE